MIIPRNKYGYKFTPIELPETTPEDRDAAQELLSRYVQAPNGLNFAAACLALGRHLERMERGESIAAYHAEQSKDHDFAYRAADRWYYAQLNSADQAANSRELARIIREEFTATTAMDLIGAMIGMGAAKK